MCVGDEYGTVSGFLQGEIEGPGHENVVAVNMVWTPFGTTPNYHHTHRQLSHGLKGAVMYELLSVSCVLCLMCVYVVMCGVGSSGHDRRPEGTVIDNYIKAEAPRCYTGTHYTITDST